MPPKKNGFYMFMRHFREEQRKLGKKPTSFQILGEQLSPMWASMSEDEKNSFKILAKQFNLNKEVAGKKEQKPLPSNSCNVDQLIPDVLSSITDKKELLMQKIILLHVNSYALVKDHYYFPAEIAALEFNLKKGVLRRYHAIIGASKICPRGFAGGMREHSDKFHKIPCWDEELPDDYKAIIVDFITFLKDGKKYDIEVCDGNLDLPEMFTIEAEPGQNLVAVKSSLNELYKTAFPDHNSKHCESIFKIKSVEKLFLEILKKLNLHLNPLSIKPGNSVRDVLESNLFGKGLSCEFHDMRDISYKCSSARVLQWMTNIFQHLHVLDGFKIMPAFHVPLTLADGSKMFIKDSSVPISMDELKTTLYGMCIEDDGFDNIQDEEEESLFTQSHSGTDGSFSQ